MCVCVFVYVCVPLCICVYVEGGAHVRVCVCLCVYVLDCRQGVASYQWHGSVAVFLWQALRPSGSLPSGCYCSARDATPSNLSLFFLCQGVHEDQSHSPSSFSVNRSF